MTNQYPTRRMIQICYPHDALRSMRPDETRLVRSRPCSPHSGTMTLITSSERRKNAFLDCLPDDRERVCCISHEGTSYWLVYAPSKAAQRALRRLGWAEERGRDLAEDRAPEVRSHRRLCGPRGSRMARHHR